MACDEAFELILMVEERVVIELKSVEQVSQAHKKQTSDISATDGLQARVST